MKSSLKTLEGISLIIHTKNEERKIKDCILSAKNIVDQIIIVDMSSTDKTVEIAKKFNAEIFKVADNKFVDDYRNFGISKAKFNWVLTLDADECLTEKLVKLIKQIVEENKYDVVAFPFKNIRLGKWMQHAGWWPDYHPRLFKKGYLKWPNKLNKPHLMPLISGKVLTLELKEENAIIHNNVVNMNSFFAKMISYYLFNGADDYFKNRKITLPDLINYYEGEFKWRFVEEKGYLDGTHGFIFSKLREYAKFIEFINWWEKNNYPEVFKNEELLKLASNDDFVSFKESKIYKVWRKYCIIWSTVKDLIKSFLK